MKELDCVEVVVEKEKYTKDGIHKGMQGWICHPQKIDDAWLVNFPQMGEHPDIATIDIKEEDLKSVPILNAAVNEKIRARFETPEKTAEGCADH